MDTRVPRCPATPQGPQSPPVQAGPAHTWRGCRQAPSSPGSPSLFSTPVPRAGVSRPYPRSRAETQFHPLDNFNPTSHAGIQPTAPREPQTHLLARARQPSNLTTSTHLRPTPRPAHSTHQSSPNADLTGRDTRAPTPPPVQGTAPLPRCTEPVTRTTAGHHPPTKSPSTTRVPAAPAALPSAPRSQPGTHTDSPPGSRESVLGAEPAPGPPRLRPQLTGREGEGRGPEQQQQQQERNWGHEVPGPRPGQRHGSALLGWRLWEQAAWRAPHPLSLQPALMPWTEARPLPRPPASSPARPPPLLHLEQGSRSRGPATPLPKAPGLQTPGEASGVPPGSDALSGPTPLPLLSPPAFASLLSGPAASAS